MRRPSLLFLLLSLAALGLYLYASRAAGFPLDDAWIHQTYARNLAASGQWAFLPGQPSAGSTSPLWTVLLAAGYWLGLEPRLWAFSLGGGLLALTAWLVYRLTARLFPAYPLAALAAGGVAALEWHLVWAAASGMETLLAAGLALAVWTLAPAQAGWLGLGAGLSVLARPDGLLLAPFALARIGLAGPAGRWRRLAWFAGGLALVLGPYLLVNRLSSGAFWPNTYYAKQAEYASLLAEPFLARAAQLTFTPWVGAQALLLPGLLWGIWRAARARQWEPLLVGLWLAGFIGSYVVRLPVVYQHGRYLMPVIPFGLALGVGGTASLLRPHSPAWGPRVFSRVGLAAGAALLLIFVFLGAGSYARDVGYIESEMVAAARWVNAHTPPGARVAAHDIGALGYFGGRPVLDLAGLISPAVIPFIRDETRLAAWLTASGAEYLVIFPDWYPDLARRPGLLPLFSAGAAHLTVYRWPASP